MARHGARRARPAELVPGTVSVITARLNYTPGEARDAWETIEDPESAFARADALGRDYHKVLRAKLQKLADRMTSELGSFHYRVFTDSAPVMEVSLAARSGWPGAQAHAAPFADAGSMFFLGELFVSLDLKRDAPVSDHCGTCARCIAICPTTPSSRPTGSTRGAASPISPSSTMDRFPRSCVRSWATASTAATIASWSAPGTSTRSPPTIRTSRCATRLDAASLAELFAWTEEEFERRFEGSAIRRIGHEAVAAQHRGGARQCALVARRRAALRSRAQHRRSSCAST